MVNSAAVDLIIRENVSILTRVVIHWFDHLTLQGLVLLEFTGHGALHDYHYLVATT